MQKVILSRAWCKEHLAQCWHKHDLQTGVNQCLAKGEVLPAGSRHYAAEMIRLESLGYVGRNTYPTRSYTRYKSQPLAAPLEWQYAESEEPEYIDVNQDW